MKAIIQQRYGGPEVLSLRDIDPPRPGRQEVLVRVRAASVNARDWHVVRGDPYLARLSIGLRRPRSVIPGTDFAGTVEALGEEVTRFRVGDEVFGEVEGAFAESLVAPETLVEHRPANLSFEQAAAVPLAANTALMGLRDVGQLQEGQSVLVNGASGGVGTFAVQIAKAMGAVVTGVCSTRNLALVRSLGADLVLDYTTTDFAATGRRHDLLLDLVGNRSLRDLRRAVRAGGTVVLSGGGVFDGGSLLGPMRLILQGQLLGRFSNQPVRVLRAAANQDNLAHLRQLIETGRVRPVIDRIYPLADVPEAIRYVESGHAPSKVVISV